MMRTTTLAAITLVIWSVWLGGSASAQLQAQRVIGRRIIMPGRGGGANLPYVQQDGAGTQWMVYMGGWIRENGMQPVVSQGESLTVNGNGGAMNGNAQAAQIDPQTGELIIDNQVFGDCTVTRRILISRTDGVVRYIDIFKNNQNQEQTISVMLQTNMNYGLNNSVTVADPKHKENQVGWVGLTGINRTLAEMFSGKGAKVAATITSQPGNSFVQASMELKIPAGKSVAIMHLLTITGTVDQGQQFILGLKESKLMRSIPSALRKLIVNFPLGNAEVGEYEILRGDAFDVVELHGGDQMRGTLKEDAYKLTTFYGTVELPKDQVIAIINAGQFRPRQLLVTVDGQVFGGRLQKDTIALELSSGQVIQIPVAQMSRVGYRKAPNEPEEWTFDKPYVLMQSGDRVNIEMPAGPIEVNTRYGLLKLDSASIATIAFQSEESGVHIISLTDGSRFSGLVTADQFNMKLAGGVSSEAVKFLTTTISRMQLAGKAPELDDSMPTLTMVNQDQLVGALTGQLKLDTAFDTLEVNGPEIKKIVRAASGTDDVQVTLWDNTTVSGQFEQQMVNCKLVCGTEVNIPLSLLAEYDQPLPRPSASMTERIKTLVGQLSADDWKQRDIAQSELVSIGVSVLGVLKEMRPNVPAEAQERIDAVLKQLTKDHADPARPESDARPVPSE